MWTIGVKTKSRKCRFAANRQNPVGHIWQLASFHLIVEACEQGLSRKGGRSWTKTVPAEPQLTAGRMGL